MIIRAPRPSERIIILALFDELKKARADENDYASRNLVYARVATRTGVTYERVVDLCHHRVYTEERPGVHYHGWKMGTV